MPIQFNPKIYLAYSPPKSCIMMEELGKGGEGIAPIGITQVFPLLSKEGILALFEELFSDHVLNQCNHISTLVPCQIHGMSCHPSFAPFNESLWTHPETVCAMSKAAGINLVPIMPYKLGHTNVQLTFGANTLSKLGREPLHAEEPIVHQESAVLKIALGFNNLPPLYQPPKVTPKGKEKQTCTTLF